MSADITIHCYPHGGVKGTRPRKPMVHILSCDEWGDVKSISFHPKDAPAIARAIIEAGRSATAGRKRKAVKIDLREHG